METFLVLAVGTLIVFGAKKFKSKKARKEGSGKPTANVGRGAGANHQRGKRTGH